MSRPERQRAFLDTNILIYTFDSKAPAKRSSARRLVARALERHDAVISFQVVQEFLNVATRKFKTPLSAAEARLYLDRVLMPLCAVVPDGSLYAEALSVSAESGISFYDALTVSSALAAGCTVLLTEDLQHGRSIRGVEIRNPFVTA